MLTDNGMKDLPRAIGKFANLNKLELSFNE